MQKCAIDIKSRVQVLISWLGLGKILHFSLEHIWLALSIVHHVVYRANISHCEPSCTLCHYFTLCTIIYQLYTAPLFQQTLRCFTASCRAPCFGNCPTLKVTTYIYSNSMCVYIYIYTILLHGIGLPHVAPGLSQHAINHIIVSDIHPSVLLIVLGYCPNLLDSGFPLSNQYCLLVFRSIIYFVSNIHIGALCY